MKKYFVLTSVFALAACGGGSGGGGNGAVALGEISAPDSGAFTQLYSDTGLGMIDINQTRAARYAQAKVVVQSIESESGVDSNALIRSATTNRDASSWRLIDGEPTREEIDRAYNIMLDVFVNGNFEGYTNHDILMSLALVFVNKVQIFNFLNVYVGNNIGDKIQGLLADLRSENKPDNVKEVISSARDLYQDFGREFNLTLRDAKFYHNSDDDNWYTFEFDESGNLTGLRERDGTVYAKDGNGSFVKERVQGYEYTFAFEKKDENTDATIFSGEIEKFYEEQPDESTLRADLLAAINERWGGDANYAEIVAFLNNATLYSIGGSSDGISTTEEEIDNAIVGRRADYTEKVKIETGSKDLGLKYSDFGLRYEEMELNQNDGLMMAAGLDHYVYSEHGGFVGGYEDKRAIPTSGMTFKGDAYVGLTRKQGDAEIEAANQLLEPSNNYYKGTADLIVKNADNSNDLEQKLVADFSNAGWYKVTVDHLPVNFPAGHYTGATVAFDAKGNNIDEKWRADPANQDGKLENENIKHYGPESNNPTEAVGFVQYIENHNSDGDWTFKADITFGAKKTGSD
jgi:hypothetical protein